jgi:hypothetical protein
MRAIANRRCTMAALDRIKSFFTRSKPQAKVERAKPAATGTEGAAPKAPETKPSGSGEQTSAGGV